MMMPMVMMQAKIEEERPWAIHVRQGGTQHHMDVILLRI
jgi:hypothetical protein